MSDTTVWLWGAVFIVPVISILTYHYLTQVHPNRDFRRYCKSLRVSVILIGEADGKFLKNLLGQMRFGSVQFFRLKEGISVPECDLLIIQHAPGLPDKWRLFNIMKAASPHTLFFSVGANDLRFPKEYLSRIGFANFPHQADGNLENLLRWGRFEYSKNTVI